jgi:glutaredoxin
MKATWAILITAVIPSVHAAQLYKWIDPATGAPVYSSDPPAAAVKSVEQKRITPSTIETSNLPYSVQRAVQRNPIVLYVSDCGEFCKSARAYLAKRGLPYTERNPEEPAVARELKKATGGALEVPFLMIGAKSVRGFDEARYAAALDAAGYPRSSLAGLGAKSASPNPTKPAVKAPDPAVAESERPATKDGADAGRTLLQRQLAAAEDAQ